MNAVLKALRAAHAAEQEVTAPAPTAAPVPAPTTELDGAAVERAREALKAYSVSGLKTFTGMEGQGFNANLLRQGRKVATVRDDASGGPLWVEWEDRLTTATVEYWHRDYDTKVDEIRERKGTIEEAKLSQIAISLPDIVHSDYTLKQDIDLLIEDIVNVALEEKTLKGRLSKAILFVHPGNPEIRSFKITPQAPREKLLAHVKAKHPQATILNEQPIKAVYDAFKAAGLIGA